MMNNMEFVSKYHPGNSRMVTVEVYKDELIKSGDDDNMAYLSLPFACLKEWLGHDADLYEEEGTADMLVGLVDTLKKNGHLVHNTEGKQWMSLPVEDWLNRNLITIADAMKFEEVEVEHLDEGEVDVTFQPFVDWEIELLEGARALTYIENNFSVPRIDTPYLKNCYPDAVNWMKKELRKGSRVTFNDFVENLGKRISEEWSHVFTASEFLGSLRECIPEKER